MIGIGILTWRRPEFVRDTILPAIKERTKGDFAVAISCNAMEALRCMQEDVGWGSTVGESALKSFRTLGSGKNLGVAGGKNRLICWALQHKIDHLFLFEDDTYPIRAGWDQWYLANHQALKVEAATWQPTDFYGGVTSRGNRGQTLVGDPLEVVGTQIDGMTLLSATRKALEAVGGMHRAFEGLNGQEHSEWMTRAHRAGMCPFTNTTFVGCEQWVDGIDYQEWRFARGLPGGKLRPPDDPQTQKVFGQQTYDKGRETFFRVKKHHRIGELWQDPCWDEATAKEVEVP